MLKWQQVAVIISALAALIVSGYLFHIPVEATLISMVMALIMWITKSPREDKNEKDSE